VIPNEIGNLLQDAGSHEDAEAAYRLAVAADPSFAPAYGNLGFLLADQGRVAESQENYARAERIHPSPRLRLVGGVMLPPVYRSAEEMAACRSRLTANLERFQEEGLRVDATLETMPTLFYSAYHGKNDRDLQVALARLGKGRPSELRSSRPRSERSKIHIGFLSSYLKDHTIGRLNVGLIAQLPRDRFHVTVLTVGQPNDPLARRIRASADRAVALPAAVPAALDVVAVQGLDILFYTDIGMNPFTYTLAFSRLAPVQCVTWGHPVTTGLPTMDYFISSRDLETEESEGQYTERLVRLSRLSVYYERLILAEAKGRAALGLPEGAHLYACPQTLFKFHPDFDPILAEILRRDPDGLLVLLESRYATWRDLLTYRLRRTCADVFERIRFLPRLHHEVYLNLLSCSDVLLDPLHFGGGNSSYEGLALGTPIVTLPSRFLRGRITYAQFRQMGLLETVVQTPEAYVELAVTLGTDRDRRQALRERILAANAVLFEDRQAVHELADFLERAAS
jgi:predicted O-linked N-acetylglucosamine transferase (SPINDLY family)